MLRLRYCACACSILGTVTALTGCGGISGAPFAASPAARVAAHAHAAAKYQSLYSFSGQRKNGAGPYGGLIAVNGTLYGTTGYGGAKTYGTVFAITASGKERTIHSFGGYDGVLPLAALINVNGTLYGTTNVGGDQGSCSSGFCGTVFSVTTAGKETLLHSFAGGNGAEPQADLLNVKGTLYSTTLAGGTRNAGTVFAITAAGKAEVLHDFGGAGDGVWPRAGLTAVDGTLYGTTASGGSAGCGSGCGTVFSITTAGKERALYDFAGGGDGAGPTARLVNVNGTLYGTTESGGNGGCGGGGCGTVFTITRSGKETVIYRFGGSHDGANPWAGLINVHGTLYGTTINGGTANLGTVFSITPAGAETVLHNFARYGDGAEPFARLLDDNGTLYGTTAYGGAHGYGTVFSLKP